MQRASSDTAADALLAMAVKQMQDDGGGRGSGALPGRGPAGVGGGASAAALLLPQVADQGDWPLLRWGSSSSRSCPGRAPARTAPRPPLPKGEQIYSPTPGGECCKCSSIFLSHPPLRKIQTFIHANRY